MQVKGQWGTWLALSAITKVMNESWSCFLLNNRLNKPEFCICGTSRSQGSCYKIYRGEVSWESIDHTLTYLLILNPMVIHFGCLFCSKSSHMRLSEEEIYNWCKTKLMHHSLSTLKHPYRSTTTITRHFTWKQTNRAGPLYATTWIMYCKL